MYVFTIHLLDAIPLKVNIPISHTNVKDNLKIAVKTSESQSKHQNGPLIETIVKKDIVKKVHLNKKNKKNGNQLNSINKEVSHGPGKILNKLNKLVNVKKDLSLSDSIEDYHADHGYDDYEDDRLDDEEDEDNKDNEEDDECDEEDDENCDEDEEDDDEKQKQAANKLRKQTIKTIITVVGTIVGAICCIVFSIWMCYQMMR